MRCFSRRRRSYLNGGREKKGWNKKQKFGLIIASILLFVIGVLLYLNYIVNPIIIQMSEAKVRSLATKAIGSAIYEIVSHGDVYDDLIKITYDDKGGVALIRANSIEINFLTRSLTRLAQGNLDKMGEKGVEIPVGSFSGLPILVGRGPSVNIKLIPIGAISTAFTSEFTEAGVNQTLHRIYVTISSKINVVLPTVNQSIQTSTQVLLCESIIIGEVPPTYLNSYSLDEMMNLIP